MMSRSEKAEKLEQEFKKVDKKEKNKQIKKGLIKIICILFVIILGLLTYMHFVGTKGLQVREYKVESNMLPDSFHGFKIVQFSDLHYLTTIHQKEIDNIVSKINELRPDLVVFTGDLIDNKKTPTKEELDNLINSLNKITATIGLYAIKGNHDYINDNFEKVFNATNFKILDNSYQLVYYKDSTPILITGIGSILEKKADIDQAFSYDKDDNLYTITLLHEPDELDNIINKYSVNLALAGHSHNGQIRLPKIGAIIKMEKGTKYPNEKYTINNTELYVSGGIGTSIYELRFFNHPSINLYRLVKGTK